MNINLHNKYEITIKDKTYVAYNTLLDTIYEKIFNLEQYTSHIAIGTGKESKTPTDTKLGNYLKTFETETSEIQSDITSGVLYIKKVVTIDEDDLDTFTFSELGITNTSEFDPVIFNHVLLTDQDGDVVNITRNVGDAMEIRVTIFLELTPESDGLFVKGENYLIQQILGENLNISDNNLYVVRGENLSPNNYTIRSTPDLTNAVVCNKKIIKNEDGTFNICFSAELGEGETEEVLIVYNNKVCLRFNTLEVKPAINLTSTLTCVNNDKILEIDNNVKNISSVSYLQDTSTIEHTTHTISKYGKKLTDKITNVFDQPFTSSTPRFVSKDGKLIAFIHDSYTHIYKYENYNFIKLNSTQVTSSDIMKIIMFEDTILVFMTEEPYLKIFNIVDKNIIEKTVNLTMYENSIYPFNWIDVDATLTLNNKIKIGFIINDDKKTPIVLTLTKNASEIYNDSITVPELTTAKKVYAIYKNPFSEPLVGFITDSYMDTTYYLIEEFLEDTKQFGFTSESAFALLNNTLGIQVSGRAILSQKDTYPYLAVYYYPDFSTVDYDFSSGIKHYTSKDGNYMIAKYEDSSYKIFNMHIVNQLTEFENGFPNYIDFSQVEDFEFVGDLLLVFVSSNEESVFASPIKNSYLRLDNMIDSTKEYTVNYNKYDLLGNRELEGVKVNLTFNFGDSNNDI